MHGQLHFDKTKMAVANTWRLDLKKLYAMHLPVFVSLNMLLYFQ